MPREMRLLGAASLWIDVTCRQERCRFEKEPLQKSLDYKTSRNMRSFQSDARSDTPATVAATGGLA
ncbi:hypothetical protein SAMN05216367_3927 [Tardiphaga sp. OK245]|nr:hypothetical protein SAMN05216367_3927 [Tardiphaga sp. OK245]